MASCYLCGCSGADYRRTVVTGQSEGSSRSSYSSYGSRGGYRHGHSYGNSTRTYTGLRTVCENCAFNIDKERLQSRIAGQWIIIVVLSILIIFTIF